MDNWHNEVLRDEGWFDYIFNGEESNEVAEPKHYETKTRASQCDLCGTRTGLHGFSFDKEGRY